MREGERTGEQWDRKAVPSSSFVMVGVGDDEGGGGHWRRLLVVIGFRSPLLSFATVRRAPLSIILSYPSRVVELFGVG